jgi:outer membrane protein assembly complex protein YaeT
MKAKDRITCGVFRKCEMRNAKSETSISGSAFPIWKSKFLLCVLCASVVQFSTALAQSPAGKVIVDDVVVYGNRTVPTARIISQIRTHPGGEYNPAELAEDVRKLTESRLLADVRPWTKELPNGRVIVNFNCMEYPSQIREIVYKNAHHLKPDELESLTGLHKGAALSPGACRQGCIAIEQRYREMGRMFATCVLEEGGQPGDTRVVFNITEGPIVRVRKISFTGVSFVGTARLKTQIDSSGAFLATFGGVLNQAMLDHDVIKLEEYYHSFGFLDAHVSRELVYLDNNRQVDVIFHVLEGRRYAVSKVFVEGAHAQDPAFIGSLIKLHQGDVYSKQTVDRDEAVIKAAYGYRGYEALVQENVTADNNKPGSVQVRYDIRESPPAKVGQIIIVGNTVTQDRVIRKEIPLCPGQILTYPDLKLAERNLARRNIFEMNQETGVHPTVEVLPNPNDSEFKDILVRVQETHTGSLLFGVGVNSDAGLVGSIVLNERNFDIFRPPTSMADILEGRAFRGAGQEFRIEAVPGSSLQRYTISFREPHLLDSDYALLLSGYYFERQYNEYQERRLGGRVGIDRQLNPFWSVSTGFRVEDVDVADVPFFAPPQVADFQGQHFLFAPRIAIRRDDRDSFLRPTQGSMIEASFEEGLGDFTFPMFNLVGSKYWTLYQRPDGSGRQVLAARSQLGIAGSNTPIYERFYAGGFQSLRGFEFRGVGPDVDGFKVGGDFLLLNSLEYQVPIKANDQLYMVAFVDSGTVESSIELKDYRVSAGVGLRIVVPMLGPVPIALDLGFPIIKGPQDKEQVFSFWVGMFR